MRTRGCWEFGLCLVPLPPSRHPLRLAARVGGRARGVGFGNVCIMTVTEDRMVSLIKQMRAKYPNDVSGATIRQWFSAVDAWPLSIMVAKMARDGLLEITQGAQLQGPGKTWKRRYRVTEHGIIWTPDGARHDAESSSGRFLAHVGDTWRRVPDTMKQDVRRIVQRDGGFELALVIRRKVETPDAEEE